MRERGGREGETMEREAETAIDTVGQQVAEITEDAMQGKIEGDDLTTV